MDMQGNRKKIINYLMFCLGGGLFLSGSHLFADDQFPVPANIQKRVDFWVKAFAQYDENDAIIHDMENPEVIYNVIHLSDIIINEIDSNYRRRRIESARTEYRIILQKLAFLKEPIDVGKLSEKEKYVYNLWAHLDDKQKFALARRRVRVQFGLKDQFKTGLERSGSYLEYIKSVLSNYGLPAELCYLPHVESAFNHKAYSKAGAAGIWQFTRYTGRRYLDINYAIDERYDPYLATEAAARLLKNNYDELGNWPLAITAYNHGINGMKRAKRKLNTDDIGVIVEKYRSRSFGFASKNFYAEFLAAKEIARNHLRYFGEVEFSKPMEFQELELPDYVTLNTLSKIFNLESQIIAGYNPAFRQPILKSTRRIPKGYKIRLPFKDGFDPKALYAHIPSEEKHGKQVRDRYYRVQSGETLGNIARRYGTSVLALALLNDIRHPNRIRAGQLLELPGNAKKPVEVEKKTEPEEEHLVLGGGLKPDHTEEMNVKIAETLSVPEENIIENARNHASIIPGAGIYGPLPTEQSDWQFNVDFEEPDNDYIIIRAEETIGHIAEWLDLPTQRLRDLNGLAYYENIRVGKRLRLDFSRTSSSEFHLKRLEYHRSIQEDFFRNFRIDGTQNYAIQMGDNIWDLCNRNFQVPLWLLMRYNKDLEIARLKQGQVITVPVITPKGESVLSDIEAE